MKKEGSIGDVTAAESFIGADIDIFMQLWGTFVAQGATL